MDYLCLYCGKLSDFKCILHCSNHSCGEVRENLEYAMELDTTRTSVTIILGIMPYEFIQEDPVYFGLDRWN